MPDAKDRKLRRQNASLKEARKDARLARRELGRLVDELAVLDGNVLAMLGVNVGRDLPTREAVQDALMALSKLKWSEVERIRSLTVLVELGGSRRFARRYLPDPAYDVRGLHEYLCRITARFEGWDKSAPREHKRAFPDRPVGLPAKLLLGLRFTTRESRIGHRRLLAAEAWGGSAETIRRWDGRLICRLIADEIVQREAARARSEGRRDLLKDVPDQLVLCE